MFVLYVYGNEAIVMWDVFKWKGNALKHYFLQLARLPCNALHFLSMLRLFWRENSRNPKETSESGM